MVSSLSDTVNPFRRDSVAYIGVGIGTTQLETAGVLALLTPQRYTPTDFLAPLDVPPTFPLTPTRTTVRYHRTFAEDEITTTSGMKVLVSELGLFTNGDPLSGNTPGRDPSFAVASGQSPVAYKAFEPVGKTDALQLDVAWEIRY